MRISTKGRYALRVMIDLARNGKDEYVKLHELSARQQISEKYLDGVKLDQFTRNMPESEGKIPDGDNWNCGL